MENLINPSKRKQINLLFQELSLDEMYETLEDLREVYKEKELKYIEWH